MIVGKIVSIQFNQFRVRIFLMLRAVGLILKVKYITLEILEAI